MKKLNLVVIGNGMVGHHFLEQLATNPKAQAFQVTVVGEEHYCAYDRVHLSEYFQGKSSTELALGSAEQYKNWGFKLHLGLQAIAIEPHARTVQLSDGSTLSYDKLVLATGSYPFIPPIEGSTSEHCFAYRTLDDLDAIRHSASQASTGVVIGGGLLGLEAAKALRDLQLDTFIVEHSPRLMSAQIDQEGGELLQEKIEALGLQVFTHRAAARITKGDNARLCVEFQDGKKLETDLIVFSAGIRPRDELPRAAGLTLGERGGVAINKHCQTSDPQILAIGEAAAWNNCCFGLVAPGYQMAKVALANLIGDELEFTGADISTKLKLMGVDVGAIGDTQGHQNVGTKVYRYLDQISQHYRKMVVSADGQRLLGAILVGDNSYYDNLMQYYRNGIDLPDHPESLILPSQSGAAPLLGMSALPHSAIICSCLNVSKGDIIDCIRAGCSSVAEVIDQSRATTGCGGCASQLKSLVEQQLTAMGMAVSKALCEHFAYTRQELEHIVRTENILSFNELVQRHGQGLGCDICKPTAANILASVQNDFILAEAHLGLQDTNDAFLANMQKDGTYSVVPRIAAGEITPDMLILLGKVARDFGLYTKITGGQRIDLFGAELSQLPAIWQRLIEAGFETGQAYGKSVRTVKSCVGSTWCRYGVQDSVGLALELENRYKGIRAPHKLKFAVSGCTRECAEAQSKDFGVIATEKGWNLYVAGNGGMRPRHADLFAQDLDTASLIRTIDRLMIFYIRTAGRLERTARWLESLEGGVDYLRNVILNDSLGLNTDLDKQMAHLVASYQCEWQTTLNNPESLKRFRQTINSPDSDPQLLFVSERGQKRPANAQERAERIALASV